MEKDMSIVQQALSNRDLLHPDVKQCLQEFEIGGWVAYSEDYYWPTFEDSGRKYTFATKKEAIADIKDAHLDSRKHQTVKRISPGKYLYDLPNINSRESRYAYVIEKITDQNKLSLLQTVLTAIDDNSPDGLFVSDIVD